MPTSVEDLKSVAFWKALAAECIGTLFLVFVACGSCIHLNPKNPAPSILQIAFAFGLSVGTMVWCICNVSGGHINPAVTMGMFITRKISVVRALLYVIVQSVGATIGAALLMAVTPEDRRSNLGATLVSPGVGIPQAFGIEVLITFVLVFTVFASCDSKRGDLKGSAPLAIGLSVTMCHTFAVQYTGSSMNSARSFGPAAAQGLWKDHWVYWAGPILGGIIAGLLYDLVFAADASKQKARDFVTKDYDPDTKEERPEKPLAIQMEDQ